MSCHITLPWGPVAIVASFDGGRTEHEGIVAGKSGALHWHAQSQYLCTAFSHCMFSSSQCWLTCMSVCHNAKPMCCVCYIRHSQWQHTAKQHRTDLNSQEDSRCLGEKALLYCQQAGCNQRQACLCKGMRTWAMTVMY